jgi:XTP/dITP diphosphohydrolase
VDGVIRATLCSRNAHKARELERLLPGWAIEPLEDGEWPDENGATYYENALGLYSARYAPEGAPAIAKLLGELEGVSDRRARYVSELVAVAPDREIFRGTGTVEGRVADEPRGHGGFGYDPVFVPDGEEQTVGQLGDEWKAANSHRARAARALREAVDRRRLAE